MAVGGGETCAFVIIYPPFEGVRSPRLGFVKDTVQCRDRFAVHSFPTRRSSDLGRASCRGKSVPMNTTYQTLIVKFSEPIAALDGIFDDAQAWGTDTLKGWIDDYESTRFTATDSHTAVITSEYNMECVKEWLQRQTPIAEMREF